MKNTVKFQTTHWELYKSLANEINYSVSPVCVKNLCMYQKKTHHATSGGGGWGEVLHENRRGRFWWGGTGET